VRPAAAAVDRYLRRVEPTAANPPHAAAAVDSWDIRADIRTGKQTTMRKDGKEMGMGGRTRKKRKESGRREQKGRKKEHRETGGSKEKRRQKGSKTTGK